MGREAVAGRRAVEAPAARARARRRLPRIAAAALWIGAAAPAPALAQAQGETPRPAPAAAAESAGGAAAPAPHGFSLQNARVPAEHVVAGGPKKGAIEAVDAPTFVAVEEAAWVAPDTPVLGVAHGGDARAYPVHVIERHQIVNDVVGGTPIAVTYDPLAGAPAAWERRVDGRVLELGVAGLLYNGNFLFFDRATESLWSQLRGEAVAGALAGRRLARVRIRQETMASWLARHPGSRVLAPPSDRVDYRQSPYRLYWVEDRIPWRVDARDERFHAKEVVLGVRRGGRARAYLGSLVTAAGGVVDDELDGRRIRLEYSSRHAVFRYEIPDDVEVQEAYWFAWKAFHPDTEIWNDPGGEAPPPERPR